MINYWFGFLKYKFSIDLFCLELLIRLSCIFFKSEWYLYFVDYKYFYVVDFFLGLRRKVL